MQATFTERMIRMIKIAVCDDDSMFISKTFKYAVSIAIIASGLDPDVRFFTDGTLLLNEFQNGVFYDIVI